MERRKLGKTGPEVGVIGLGTEHLERSVETMDAVLRAAVEAGANYVDLLYVEPDYWETFGSRIPQVPGPSRPGGPLGQRPALRPRLLPEHLRQHAGERGQRPVEVAMMTMIDDGDRTGSAWREASLEHLRRYQEQGRVGLIGGSAHDPAIAREAVRSGLLDVLMFPINMLGHDDEPTSQLSRPAWNMASAWWR